MLENVTILILPSVIDVLITVNIKNKDSYNINTFMPEVNSRIKELSKHYIIDTILIVGATSFSKKIYENLLADNDIKYPIKLIGENV